jgi:putative transcriptional regulator
MTQVNYVGRNLRRARGSRTQEEIAKAIDVTQSAYSQYESGSRMPRHEIMLRLARFFGVTVDSLFFTDELNEVFSSEAKDDG